MHINILNRKTCKIQKLKIDKVADISSIKTVALSVIADTRRYALSVCADSQKDIDLIYNNFNNIPIPTSPDVKRAIWTGDLAAFIVLNYPSEAE